MCLLVEEWVLCKLYYASIFHVDIKISAKRLIRWINFPGQRTLALKFPNYYRFYLEPLLEASATMRPSA